MPAKQNSFNFLILSNNIKVESKLDRKEVILSIFGIKSTNIIKLCERPHTLERGYVSCKRARRT